MRELSRRGEVAANQTHDAVAVYQTAILVGQYHPVGVAVERQADIRAFFDSPALHFLGMQRPAAAVDVEAVGGAGERDHIGS